MSNVVTQNEARPAHLQQYFGRRDDSAFDIPAGKTMAILAPKNNVWRLKFGKGEPIEIQDNYLDVVFVAAHEKESRVFFAQDWGEDPSARPACGSMDGVVPDPQFQPPQAPYCKGCRWDAWRSATVGTGKRCKQHLRTAVAPVVGNPMQGGKVVANEAYNGSMLYRIMPGSFNNYLAYRGTLKSQGKKIFEGITRLSFDRKTNGVIQYQWVRYLDAEESKIVDDMFNDPHTQRVTSMDDGEVEQGYEDPVQGTISAPQPVQQVQTPPPQAPAQQAPQAVSSRPRGAAFAGPAAQGELPVDPGPQLSEPRPNPFASQAPISAQVPEAPPPQATAQRRTRRPRAETTTSAEPAGNGQVPNGEATKGFVSTDKIMADLDSLHIPD